MAVMGTSWEVPELSDRRCFYSKAQVRKRPHHPVTLER